MSIYPLYHYANAGDLKGRFIMSKLQTAEQEILKIVTKLEKDINVKVDEVEVKVKPYIEISDRKIYDINITIL